MDTHNTRLLVFTDLDGSLLDHDSYDFSPAIPAMNRLHTLNIPIIPTTSKTLAEIENLAIDFKTPIHIAENGMVIRYQGRHHIPGKDYQGIIQFIQHLPADIQNHINGFHMMEIEDVMRHTGLDRNGATLAKNRLASEPFLWSGTPQQLAYIEDRAHQHGLAMTQGGRFYHLMGHSGGKDSAIHWVLQQYVQNKEKTYISIALGDGPNDAQMISTVDYGVIIPNAHGPAFEVIEPSGTVLHAPYPGPKGWNDAMHSILDDLGFDR